MSWIIPTQCSINPCIPIAMMITIHHNNTRCKAKLGSSSNIAIDSHVLEMALKWMPPLRKANAHAQSSNAHPCMLNYLDKSRYLQCYKPDSLECLGILKSYLLKSSSAHPHLIILTNLDIFNAINLMVLNAIGILKS